MNRPEQQAQTFKFLLPSEKKFVQISVNKPIRLEDLKYYFEKVLGYKFFNILLLYYLDDKLLDDSLSLLEVKELTSPKDVIEIVVKLDFQ